MQNSIHRKLCFMRAACVLAALTISAAAHAANISYETRALTGTDGPLGPGLGAGVNFLGLTNPVLNSSGQIAFRSSLTGTGVTLANNTGIWSEGGGSGLALVARRGSPAPGTEVGVNFSSFGSPVLNDAGQTAFSGILIGMGVTPSNNNGIWSEGGGSGLALVAREGDQAPGTDAGVTFSTFNIPALNGAGQILFWGSLAGPGVTSANSSAIFRGGSDSLALAYRKGQEAPGVGGGAVFIFLGGANSILNATGQTAFRGQLGGPGVTTSNNTGIWSEGNGSLALVARTGNAAPHTGPGVMFSSLVDPALNGAGQTAFRCVFLGPGVDGSNNEAIYTEGGGSGLALVALEGQQAPGTEEGVVFSGFLLAGPVINGAGQTAFLAGTDVDGPDNTGIWSEGGGSGLALVARKGLHAPGTAAGVIFDHFENPVINGTGHVAFLGFLSGPGVFSANNRGIWATDTIGQSHLIARTRDQFDVSNDPANPDRRTISALSLVTGSGGEDGQPMSFNDAGQLAFLAGFTDGSSGIFVATIGTSFKLTITPAIAPATGHDLAWDSQPGKVYDLVTSTDLSTPVSEWPVHAAYGDIPAAGTTTTLTAVPVDGPQRFFAVVEKNAPPAN